MAKFCFVIHPTSFEDVVRYEPGAAGKGRPIVAKILEWMPEYAAAHLTGIRTPDGRETEGWFVAAPLLPETMLELPREAVYARILRAIDIGVELGADIAGLGAFTGVVGDAGVTLAERAPIPVTTGNSLTIAAGVRSLFRGAAEMGIDSRVSTAVVVGATGSIGSACVELIAPHVEHIIMVARNATRLSKLHAALAPRLACESSHTLDIAGAVRRADLVLTATSSTQELIEPEDLRTGAVVCELSLPHDVSRRVAADRPDVLVVEGGNMRVPGDLRAMRVREADRPFDLNLPRGTLLACMSETAILALENRCEPFTVGRGIDLAKVREIELLAERCGFSLGDMRAFDTAITREQVAAVRAAAARRRNVAS
jgi:fatty aldehyde-generating acyl-ACP reductase